MALDRIRSVVIVFFSFSVGKLKVPSHTALQIS